MAYKHDDKSSGQLIRSADWNLMGHELERLEVDKVNRAGDTIKGDLKVTGKFTGSEGRFESSLGVGGNFNLGGTLRVDGNIITTADLVGNIAIDDTRDINEAPSVFGREVSFDFKRRNVIGVPGAGEYSATMTLAPWADNSGNNHHQLNFNDGGLFWRQGAPQGAWGGWVRLAFDGIKDSFAFRGQLTVGGGWASSNNYMAGGSLTIGNTETNYGGGSNWNSSTAGLLLEAKKNTEIAVHDSGTRVASLMYYEGDADNRITIGRDMGWGTIGEVAVKGRLSVTGTFNASKDPDSAMSNGGLFVLKGNAPQLDFIDTDHNDWSIHVNSNKMYFIRQPWEYQDLVLDGAGHVGIGTDNPGSFKLNVNGDFKANRIVVQDNVDGGATRGIWMWNGGDSNWGIYMGTSGASKSLAGQTAVGGDGFGSHAIRLRTYSDQNNGIIYENHKEQLNFSVRASDGHGYFRGSLTLGNSDLYFSNPDHRHSGIGNTDGWAAIENAKDYDALMILGRAHSGGIRTVKLWDYLEVNGEFRINSNSGRSLVMQNDGNLVIYAGGRAIWATNTNTSDARLKKDIHPLKSALEKLLSIKGVSFSWADEVMGTTPQLGILAQDVEKVFPELVSSVDQQYKSVKYDGLIPVLIEAIRELNGQVLSLQAEVQALRS
ncbi:MAG: hypothetical protein Fur0044_28020 [Anaerolineae bacterium]|nr:tail fiber domain-containing protein [Anaerolineales bacterium]